MDRGAVPVVVDDDAEFGIIGASPAMREIFTTIAKVASSRATVLLTGESGTGKELIAAALHRRSARAAGPFVKVHCASLAETLLESELFGHERGAFTGATHRREGRFEQAHRGTLFLDEIGEISAGVQVKLLRFLQTHELERVGGNETLRVDVRVIAATNRDLGAEVLAGRFREDLFYRLNVINLEVPPLRARPGDVAMLAAHFCRRFAVENGRAILGFTDEALARLVAHPWPGNVRELENAVERAVILCAGPLVTEAELPRHLRGGDESDIRIPGSTMAEIERHAITKTVEAVGGSTSRAAAMLGMSVRTIQYKLQQYRRSCAEPQRGEAPDGGTPPGGALVSGIGGAGREAG